MKTRNSSFFRLAIAVSTSLLLLWLVPALASPQAAPSTAEQADTPPVTNAPSTRPHRGVSEPDDAAAEQGASGQLEPNDKDDGPLGDIITGLSTLVAAAVGFWGAMWVERRSWERRKAEQIRDKQLSTILETARVTQKAANCLEAAQAKYSLAFKQSAAPNIDILQAEAQASAITAIQTLSESASLLNLLALELRVLKVQPASVAIVDVILSDIRLATDKLRAGVGSSFDEQKAKAIIACKIDIIGLVENAIAGLRKE